MTHTSEAAAAKFGLSKHEFALVGVTALWGSTFLIIHTAMDFAGPMFFVGVRFLTAGLVAAAVFWRWLRGLTLLELGAGLAIGASLALGYGLQTIGLQSISSSMSGFITAFYVPLVPLMQWAFLRKRPGKMSFIGAGLAFAGLVVLGGPGAAGFSFGFGEWITVAAAVACAVEVILISAFASKRVEFRRVTVVQLLAAGGFAFLAMPITGESVPAADWRWIVPAVALGGMSMVIQLTMNWAQRHVSATRATIIYSAEPVWAGLIGWVAGDQLPWFALGGAALIVAGVLVSELKPPPKSE
ncbi:MAG: DMT family transporter [Actinobacteria bacterium]|nr:DMT family transporter [Actinomycetota bacterium]